MKFYRHDRDSNPGRCGENQTCQPLHHRPMRRVGGWGEHGGGGRGRTWRSAETVNGALEGMRQSKQPEMGLSEYFLFDIYIYIYIYIYHFVLSLYIL